jgi:hypothetical protein
MHSPATCRVRGGVELRLAIAERQADAIGQQVDRPGCGRAIGYLVGGRDDAARFEACWLSALAGITGNIYLHPVRCPKDSGPRCLQQARGPPPAGCSLRHPHHPAGARPAGALPPEPEPEPEA